MLTTEELDDRLYDLRNEYKDICELLADPWFIDNITKDHQNLLHKQAEFIRQEYERLLKSR